MEPPPARWTSKKRRAYQDAARTIVSALGHASPFLEQRLREKIERYNEYIDRGG